MIWNDILIFLIGVSIGIFSFWSDKKRIRIVAVVLGLLLCIAGTVNIIVSQQKQNETSKYSEHYNKLQEMIWLRLNGELSEYITKLGDTPLLKDSLLKLQKYILKDDERASGYFSQALDHPKLKDDSLRPLLLRGYGLCLGRLNKLEKAKKCFQEAIELTPDSADLYIDRGIFWRENSNDKKPAIQDAEKAIGLDPRSWWAHLLKGALFCGDIAFDSILSEESISNAKIGIESLNQAINLEPTESQSYWFRGQCFQITANWENAANDYQAFIDLSLKEEGIYIKQEGRSQAYLALAQVKASAGEFCQAFQMSEEALRLWPEYSTPHVMKGLLLIQFPGLNIQAKKEFDTALKLEKKDKIDPFLSGGIGIVKFRSMDYEDAFYQMKNYCESLKNCSPIITSILNYFTGNSDFKPQPPKDGKILLSLIDTAILRQLRDLNDKKEIKGLDQLIKAFSPSLIPYGVEENKQAVCLYSRFEAHKYLAQYASKVAQFFMLRQNFTEALEYANYGIAACNKMDNCDKGPWVGNLALILYNLNRYEEALDNAIQAFKIFTSSSDTNNVMATRTMVKIIFEKLKDQNFEVIYRTCKENPCLVELCSNYLEMNSLSKK